MVLQLVKKQKRILSGSDYTSLIIELNCLLRTGQFDKIGVLVDSVLELSLTPKQLSSISNYSLIGNFEAIG
jgi:hypothetical protein